jgi:hypothetical protein
MNTPRNTPGGQPLSSGYRLSAWVRWGDQMAGAQRECMAVSQNARGRGDARGRGRARCAMAVDRVAVLGTRQCLGLSEKRWQ